jgi:hypothetical protein
MAIKCSHRVDPGVSRFTDMLINRIDTARPEFTLQLYEVGPPISVISIRAF